MEKVKYLLCTILFVSCIFALGKMEEDKYVKMTVEEIIDELGSPDFDIKLSCEVKDE